MCRYVAAELATDIIVNVGDIKFYLHKVLIIFQSSKHFKFITRVLFLLLHLGLCIFSA